LPSGSNFPKQKKTKCQSQASSPWNKKKFYVKKTTFLGRNEFSLGKGTFLGKQCTFLRERLKFHGEIYVLNIFVIMVISFLKKKVLQPLIRKV
jgi:hypothetical protein